MNAWITSVLILLSAADEKRGVPRASHLERDSIRREGQRPCEASNRSDRCTRGLAADHTTVCRACFRD
jgi:hypothetical protein